MSDDPKDGVNEFRDAVKDLATAMREQAKYFTKPPDAPKPQADLRPEALSKMANDAGVGEVMRVVGENVLLPMQSKTYDLAIKANRRAVERDPELGKYAKKYSRQIDEAIQRDPAGIAENGLESVVQGLRDSDPEYRSASVEAEVSRRLAEERAKNPAPQIDRPGGAPAKAAPSPDDASAVEVSDDEVEFFQLLVPGATKQDVQKQRHDIAKQRTKLGPAQIRKMGGVPILDLEEIGQEHKP